MFATKGAFLPTTLYDEYFKPELRELRDMVDSRKTGEDLVMSFLCWQLGVSILALREVVVHTRVPFHVWATRNHWADLVTDTLAWIAGGRGGGSSPDPHAGASSLAETSSHWRPQIINACIEHFGMVAAVDLPGAHDPAGASNIWGVRYIGGGGFTRAAVHHPVLVGQHPTGWKIGVLVLVLVLLAARTCSAARGRRSRVAGQTWRWGGGVRH